jgi:8-oxo-dGTP diphosphatase
MSVILTVDVALVAGDELLLIRRAIPPFLDRLVLPGGHVDPEDSGLAAAAARELLEETGVALRPEDLKFLCLLDSPGRDPRPGRRMSVAFTAACADRSSVSAAAGSDAREIVWRRLGTIRPDEIGFDHWQAIAALGRAKDR